MARAVAMFRKKGMNPVPFPTGHRVKKNQRLNPIDIFPQSVHLKKSEVAIYEILSYLWASIKGQI
jgi:uncharacterized SAM-binding protein YcdF (DUF218 family)